ncbi:MAG TPA: class II aldolase/adducin family protein [Paracoccaceae bacterium]|nr:class II aldolase/adducin family protein [Paracoccaceae bacterium]
MSATEEDLRREIVAASRRMIDAGLSQGTSGNISVRCGNAMLITPSAVPAGDLTPGMIVRMRLDAEDGQWEGKLRPSTEWPFHRAILRERPEFGAVVHTHSPHATALAIARKPIPPCHYMIAVFGGDDVRVADYATFGTEALSQAALRALAGRNACLLANHGAIAAGPDLTRAMWLADELETLARQYCLSLAIGGPVLLGAAELAETAAAITGYGAGARD